MPVINVNTPVIDRAHFITSPFGVRSLNGKKTLHNGIDIVGFDGKSTCTATILAYAYGKVIAEGVDAKKGNFIELKHASCISVYYHMENRSPFKVGETVKKGDAIGYIGNTGNSTGAHLHFGIKETEWINPLPFLQEGDGMDYETWKRYKAQYDAEQNALPASEWAKESVEWSEKSEIIFGDGNGNIMPKAPCTREMVAVILARFYRFLNK